MNNPDGTLPKRKRIRLEGYDYSSNGSYFVTICIKDPSTSLWTQVGADIIRPDYEFIEDIDFPLSKIGKSIWQKSFNDSIIDSDKVYGEVWEYINNNPRKIHKEFRY